MRIRRNASTTVNYIRRDIRKKRTSTRDKRKPKPTLQEIRAKMYFSLGNISKTVTYIGDICKNIHLIRSIQIYLTEGDITYCFQHTRTTR